MKAININDEETPFTNLILDGMKTVETREKPTLRSLVGQRVGIIRTGCGKAKLVGYVDIVAEIMYSTYTNFTFDYLRHRVRPYSKYDMRGCVKWGYILKNPERCEPIEVDAKGIVIRNI